MKLLIAATLASSLATSAWAAPYLTVSEIDVKDPAAYKEWLPDVQKHIADAGGKYLAGGFEKTTMLIGPPVHNRLVIIQYPDKATWEKWWKETGDADIKKAEGKFATFRIYGVEGIDAPAPAVKVKIEEYPTSLGVTRDRPKAFCLWARPGASGQPFSA